MTPSEKLEQIKRERTPHSTEELERLGKLRYEGIQSELEARHHGGFVMIEVDSGEYFVGSTPQLALDQAQTGHPGKVFYLIRIGHKAAHKLKTHGNRQDNRGRQTHVLYQ
jgi:hypothetical protein